MAVTANTMLNKGGENGNPSLLPDLRSLRSDTMKPLEENIGSKLFLISFLWLHRVVIAFALAFSSCKELRATLHCSVKSSHCGGFSCCGAQALGVQASVVAT